MENGRRNFFMTKSPQKNVPDVEIDLSRGRLYAKRTRFRSSYRARKVRKGGYQRYRKDCFSWKVLAYSYSPTARRPVAAFRDAVRDEVIRGWHSLPVEKLGCLYVFHLSVH